MNAPRNDDEIAFTPFAFSRPGFWQQVAAAQQAKARRYRGLTYRQVSRIERGRLTSAPLRRTTPTRRPGAVVARRRTAGTGKPSGSSGGDGPGQSDEPSGLAARVPRAMSAPHHVPAIAAGTSSCPKEATR